jgi:ATP synthase protein I
MTDPKDLKERIAAAKERYDTLNPPHVTSQSGREMSAGIRAFMEMFGVLLGSGLMGYAFDAFFGTAPTLLIIFILLGIVAAIFNLYKLSKNLGTAIGSNNLQSQNKMGRNLAENDSAEPME